MNAAIAAVSTAVSNNSNSGTTVSSIVKPNLRRNQYNGNSSEQLQTNSQHLNGLNIAKMSPPTMVPITSLTLSAETSSANVFPSEIYQNSGSTNSKQGYGMLDRNQNVLFLDK